MGLLGAALFRVGEEAEAEQWLRKAAAAGHLDSASYLAGVYVDRNRPREAEAWMRKAAEDADPQAMTRLGAQLAKQPDQMDEAVSWLRRAADAGDRDGAFVLGLVHLEEWRQPREAEPWLRRAAEAGHAQAMAYLAPLLLWSGQMAEAERWLREAAQHMSRDDIVRHTARVQQLIEGKG